MASADDTLKASLGTNAYESLCALAKSSESLAGRAVAERLNVAPTTANDALKKLQKGGLAHSSKVGRAVMWRLNPDHPVIRSWLEDSRAERAGALAGVSPYSTGGGGVTFERKLAVRYLSLLLTGESGAELGDGNSVLSVGFQQAPEHSVDDLVVHAAPIGVTEPSLILAVAVRRAPKIVKSDSSSRELFRDFATEVATQPVFAPEHKIVLVVAGPQDHATELATLASHAATQSSAAGFFSLLRTPQKFSAKLRDRLEHVLSLVTAEGQDEPSAEIGTWKVLSRLTVLQLRFEGSDEADWASLVNSLRSVARDGDLAGAAQLRDKLVGLASEYSPKAAVIDREIVRRDAYNCIDLSTRRFKDGWRALDLLHSQAVLVRSSIGPDERAFHLDRSAQAKKLLSLASSPAILAHGESGVGKSALVIQTMTSLAKSTPSGVQVVCLNLRGLPPTSLQFESLLKAPLAALLRELSAPQRLLVVDGADAAAEGNAETLKYVAAAAKDAGVTFIGIAASETKQLLADTLRERGLAVAEFGVDALGDEDIDHIVAAFPELTELAANVRARELLRKPIVVDLLVRSRVSGDSLPLTDADAMNQIWAGMVRRREQPDRGTPDAREIAFLRLAALSLGEGDQLAVLSSINPQALQGLRKDGLLRSHDRDPFHIGPVFAHDELRRYAVAVLLLASGNMAARLLTAHVPRWTLGAARLACQLLLVAPDGPNNRFLGRFERLQREFDSLTVEHGERWGDVPGEALLTLSDPGPILRGAWPQLLADGERGLQRLGRLVSQRLRDKNGAVRAAHVAPLVELLLESEMPWEKDHRQELIREWLRTLVLSDAAAGNALRVRLRERLVAFCDLGQSELEKEQLEAQSAPLLVAKSYPWRNRVSRRREVPHEMTSQEVVEFLALLGPDLGEQGEAILRRVASGAPSFLAPALEEPLTGRALASAPRGLLAELTNAYYIEKRAGEFDDEDGIRSHQSRSFGVSPLSAWYRGPFYALFLKDFPNGVAVLNRMLNHAAKARAATLTRLDRDMGRVGERQSRTYRLELSVTGVPRTFVGDAHVWAWYRGTGFGPYPCMSALQALEHCCEQLLSKKFVSVRQLVAMLLEGCESLAMLGLVLGLLVRSFEETGDLLDSYLAEPTLWHLEFDRVMKDRAPFAASSEGMRHPERRGWSLREVSMQLVLCANDQRVQALKMVSERLIANARQQIVAAGDGSDVESRLLLIRGWAASLDRTTYVSWESNGNTYLQSRPPDEVTRGLQAKHADLTRSTEGMRLRHRYRNAWPLDAPLQAPELADDLNVAQSLLENVDDDSLFSLDSVASVAAIALEAHLLGSMGVSEEHLRFAVDLMRDVALGKWPGHDFDYDESIMEWGANRSAARALPLLLLNDRADAGVMKALSELARSSIWEVRNNLARALDHIWSSPCLPAGQCHHQKGFALVAQSIRNCLFPRDHSVRGTRNALIGPLEAALAATNPRDVDFSRLDVALRALAPAASSAACVASSARSLLNSVFVAHRLAQLSHAEHFDHRGTHALCAARALLTLAQIEGVAPILEHVGVLKSRVDLLETFFRALSAAASEPSKRGRTAADLWPELVSFALEEVRFSEDHRRYGARALASLLPNPTGESSYLYKEVKGSSPIYWWNPAELKTMLTKWIPHARGLPDCVDHAVAFVLHLPRDKQAEFGVPLVLELLQPEGISYPSALLETWLVEVREASENQGLQSQWQRLVDALVVAGSTRLAPYSE